MKGGDDLLGLILRLRLVVRVLDGKCQLLRLVLCLYMPCVRVLVSLFLIDSCILVG